MRGQPPANPTLGLSTERGVRVGGLKGKWGVTVLPGAWPPQGPVGAQNTAPHSVVLWLATDSEQRARERPQRQALRDLLPPFCLSPHFSLPR